MKERPILFSAPMVRAILEGRKTQTRRVVKPPRNRDSFVVLNHGEGWWPYQSDDGESEVCSDGNERPYNSPYGQPGDRLWVREAFRFYDSRTECACYDPCNCARDNGKPIYRATADCSGEYKWKPSIHMPRWASRITLEIVSVRVERLNEIRPADCIAEGIEVGDFADIQHDCANGISLVDRFCALWESINGAGSWQQNPWVWVIEFRRGDV
jgi:hypothetical protein